MNKHLETLLVKACIDSKKNKTTTLGNSEHQVDITKYRCEIRLKQEMDKIFKKLPFIVLHSSELNESNRYKSVDTNIGSLIATRDTNGEVHVFHNSCRHRGAKIVDGSGCNKLLVCPYHAWSYSLEGELKSVPGQMHCFPELNKADNALICVPSIEKHGFIWAIPNVNEGRSLEEVLGEYLGDIAPHLEWMDGPNLKVFKHTQKVWNANWKIFTEGGLETYHFSFAHKDTIARNFQNNIAVIDQLGMHFRVIMPTRAIDKPGLMQQEYLSLREHSHTLFYVMPNVFMLVQENHVEWISLRPIAVDQSEITVTTLIPCNEDLDNEKTHSYWQKNHHITNLTLDEDWKLGVGIQESVTNGHLPFLRYGKNEWALKALNDEIERLLSE